MTQTRKTKSRTTTARQTAQVTRTRQTDARKAVTKIGTVIALLQRPRGATLGELCAETSWQAHSVRGALSGSLRKKGLEIVSEKTDGVRRYRIEAPE